MRNGADVLLKSLFVGLGGARGLTLFAVVLAGVGAVLVWRDLRRGGPLRLRVFVGMGAESIGYGLSIGVVAGALTAWVLHPVLAAVQGGRSVGGGVATLGLPEQIMVSLGAGVYEELVFRVLLVGALHLMARRLFGWRPGASAAFAVLAGALVFSGFHYVGPYGDPWSLGSFTFRAVAGVLFSGMYLLRGFGITAWSHALYDVFFALAVVV